MRLATSRPSEEDRDSDRDYLQRLLTLASFCQKLKKDENFKKTKFSKNRRSKIPNFPRREAPRDPVPDNFTYPFLLRLGRQIPSSRTVVIQSKRQHDSLPNGRKTVHRHPSGASGRTIHFRTASFDIDTNGRHPSGTLTRASRIRTDALSSVRVTNAISTPGDGQSSRLADGDDVSNVFSLLPEQRLQLPAGATSSASGRCNVSGLLPVQDKAKRRHFCRRLFDLCSIVPRP